jgi:hypothetical protein
MTPELETVAEIHKTRHRWVDISVAVCALIVSITSLCVAVLHGHTMERMADANARLVAANSWPMLQRYYSDLGEHGERVFSINVANSGVGPAKVETVEVLWKGTAVRTYKELLERCCGAAASAAASGAMTDPLQDMETSSLQGMVLRAGENRRILSLPRSGASEAVAKAFAEAQRDITMRVCYCSVFDECWSGDLHTLHPASVAQCPAPDVMFVVN